MLRINAFGALYVRDGERQVAGAAAQPRRLAVLAVLARAGERGVTRDKLLALLWPDSADEPGRRALAQALYALRRDLGNDEVFVGVKDVRLNPDVISSDVGEFDAAVAGGELERAVGLYAGPFLDGFRVPGLDEFDRWVETERAALALRHAETLEALAARAEKSGDAPGAVAWWRRLAGTDPLSARVAVRLMRALDAAGDRAGALQHARIHESLVDAHLGLPPSPEVTALAERLRTEPEPPRPTTPPAVIAAPGPERRMDPVASSGPPADVRANASDGEGIALVEDSLVHAGMSGVPESTSNEGASVAAVSSPEMVPISSPERVGMMGTTSGSRDDAGVALLDPPATDAPQPRGVTAVASSGDAKPRRARIGWSARAAIAALALLVAAVAGWALLREDAEDLPLLAVGRVASYTGQAPGTAAPLADLLATGLARVRGVHVVSRARVFEKMRGGSDSTGAALAAAAREAGATQLVEGDVYRSAVDGCGWTCAASTSPAAR